MPNQNDFPNEHPLWNGGLVIKKRNPRDSTASITARARKNADAEIMAEIRKLKARVKALEKALSAPHAHRDHD